MSNTRNTFFIVYQGLKYTDTLILIFSESDIFHKRKKLLDANVSTSF